MDKRVKLLFIFISLLIPNKMGSQIIYEVSPYGTFINSLKGAKEDIETRLNAGILSDYVVILDEGHYYFDEPLVFDQNVVSTDHSITFIAKEGTTPVISGGEVISFVDEDDARKDVLKAYVNHDVRNLWINNVRMKRASGYVGYATGFFNDVVDGKVLKGLIFPKDNFPLFEDISGLEIKYYKNWRNYYFKVDSILDSSKVPSLPETSVAVVIKNFEAACEVTPKMVNIGSNESFYFENSIELLDEPGEWCYSPMEQVIYYYPYVNETADNLNAIVPKLQNIISIKTKTKDNSVRNLTFSGLNFSHTNWDWISENGFFPKQSSTYCPEPDARSTIPAAVVVEDARNVRFEKCRFSMLGSNGIHIKNSVDSIEVDYCNFEDLSGAAVCISDCNHRTYSDTICPVKNVEIKNNHIENIGEEFASCPGIEAYFCEDLTISHNELYDLPYTGISVGWGWTKEPTSQKNIRILNNKIIGNTLKCSDGGAIYTLSHFGGEGILIEGNYIEEISNKPCEFTQGSIYTDEGSSSVYIKNNVVLSDRKWFFHHWAGAVVVDSIYVAPENRDNYGGEAIPSGGTEIQYIGNGDHIFCLPHYVADSIINNSGIRKDEFDITSGLDMFNNLKNHFLLKKTQEGLKIILPSPKNEGQKITVNLYGIDGSLKRSETFLYRIPIDFKLCMKGFYFLEVVSAKERKAIPVIF